MFIVIIYIKISVDIHRAYIIKILVEKTVSVRGVL
jgi:hypothetical protein